MNIETINNEGNIVVKPYGRLNSATAGELDEKLKDILSKDVSSLAIDMEEVDFISSMGIRVLVAAYKEMEGKEFSILNSNASIKEILRLSGLLKVFKVE